MAWVGFLVEIILSRAASLAISIAALPLVLCTEKSPIWSLEEIILRLNRILVQPNETYVSVFMCKG